MGLRSFFFGERDVPITIVMNHSLSKLDRALYERRERDLLEANNRYQQEARDARAMLALAEAEIQKMRAAICNIKAGEVVSDEHFEILMDSLEAPKDAN